MQEKISRRLALQLGLGALVGYPVVSTLLREHSVIETRGFISDNVQYIPLYENHATGIKEVLPRGLDGLFIEFTLEPSLRRNNAIESQTIYSPQFSADQLMQSFINYNTNYPSRARETAMINQAITNKTLLGFGDINVLGISLPDAETERRQFYSGILLSLGAMIEAKRESLERQRTEQDTQQLTRRRILASFIQAGIFIEGLRLTTSTSIFEQATAGKAIDTNPVDRFLLRLYGLSSHVHPENPIVFVRNVLMAYKTRMLGDYLIELGYSVPSVGFNVGAAHSGMEDMLALPKWAHLLVIRAISQQLTYTADVDGSNMALLRILQGEFNPDSSWNFTEVARISDPDLNQLLPAA